MSKLYRTTSLVLATSAALLAVPTAAFADDAAIAPVAPAPGPVAIPVAPVAASSALSRPIAMHDLAPTTTLGARVSASGVGDEGPDEVFIGELVLDADVAVGPSVKIFGTLPLVMARDTEGDAEGLESNANVTIGALAHGRSQALSGALGASVSFGAGEESFVGLYAHYDIASYWRDKPLSVFGVARMDAPNGYIEGQLTWIAPLDESEGSDIDFATVHIGGGARLGDGNLWFVGEAGAVQPFNGDADEEAALIGQIGLRGALSGTSGSWLAGVSFAHVEEIETIGATFELRAAIL
jgi:hypothetical protein